MQRILLSGTTLQCSTHVLGTDYFGTQLSCAEAFSLIDEYIAAGGNVLDTARIYGGWVDGKLGTSEEVIGSYFQKRGGRDKVVIATKCAHHDLRDSSIRRLSRAAITADVEDSLRALKMDTIDLLFLHRDDDTRPVEEIMDTLNALVQSGKVRYIAASNWTAKRIAAANAYAASCGQATFCASQIKWSLAKENAAEEDPTLVAMDKAEYPFYEQNHFPVFAYASQAKGFFKKMEQGGEAALSEKAKNRYYLPENLEYYSRAEKLAQEAGVSVSAVVLAYLLSQPMDVFPILGCKTPVQLHDSLASSDFRLDSASLSFLAQGRL